MVAETALFKMRQSPPENKERFCWIRGGGCGNLSRHHENIPAYWPHCSPPLPLSPHKSSILRSARRKASSRPAPSSKNSRATSCSPKARRATRTATCFSWTNPTTASWNGARTENCPRSMQPSGYANGMYFDAKGNLIACARRAQPALVHRARQNRDRADHQLPRQISQRPERRVGCAQRRDVYHRPVLQRTWWDHTDDRAANQEVFYLSPDRKNLTRVTDDLQKPNGITGTPDGKNLFVADMGAEPDLALRHPAGRLADEQNFVLQRRLGRHDD